MENILRKLSNNFEPIHGHGSLEDDLEDQWEAQQELLKERKRKNIDKQHLMEKYKDPEARKSFNLDVGSSSSKSKSSKKAFWDKNVSPWTLLEGWKQRDFIEDGSVHALFYL